jgi:hypothetical protein
MERSMERKLENDKRIHPIPETGCWIWAGNSTDRGYGQIIIGGKKYYAHRVIYEQTFNVKLDKKDVICHVCDNPSCVNPQHLFRGTQADNLKDMAKKGRSTRGEKNPMAKLTDGVVEVIKGSIAMGAKDTDIAERFGISRAAVNAIRNNKRWAHV